MIQYALNFCKKYKASLVLYILVLVISMCCMIITPYFNGYFIDCLIQTASMAVVVKLAIALMVIGFGGAIFSYFANMMCMKLLNQLSYDMENALIIHVQRLPYNEYTQTFEPAYLSDRIRKDVSTLLGFVLNNFIQVFTNFIMFFVTIYIIYRINVKVLLLMLVIAPIYLAIYIILKKPYLNKCLEMKEKETVFFNKQFQRLEYILEIKADSSYEKDRNRMNHSFGTYLQSVLSYGKIQYLYLSLDHIIKIVFQVCLLLVGGMEIINHNLTIGQFSILVVYFMNLINTMAFYFNLGSKKQEAGASYKRIQEIEEMKEENNGEDMVTAIDDISLDMVDYSYNKEDIQLVLADFCCDFRKNTIYILSGKNGTGKTTLLYLITGILQELENGSLKINGKDIETLDMLNIRKDKISIFLQTNRGRDLAVREFLEMELELPFDTMISRIYEQQLDSMFCSNHFNIHDYVDKKINSLSGGERQKVYLLKALLKDSELLILDEPSNHLDTETVDMLTEHMNKMKKNRIIIMSTHDSRLKKTADYCIDMEEGQIEPIV
jgi:ABC-type bacteriocin/lantibiotic exporter with double-glycine peptidase domain